MTCDCFYLCKQSEDTTDHKQELISLTGLCVVFFFNGAPTAGGGGGEVRSLATEAGLRARGR